MLHLPINEVAVLVVALLSVSLGSIWYSPVLFGGVWMRSQGKHIEDYDPTDRELVIMVLKAVVVNILLYGLIAVAIIRTQEWVAPRVIGAFVFSVCMLFVAILTIWERRPFLYLLVHLGYCALALTGGITVIVLWPW